MRNCAKCKRKKYFFSIRSQCKQRAMCFQCISRDEWCQWKSRCHSFHIHAHAHTHTSSPSASSQCTHIRRRQREYTYARTHTHESPMYAHIVMQFRSHCVHCISIQFHRPKQKNKTCSNLSRRHALDELAKNIKFTQWTLTITIELSLTKQAKILADWRIKWFVRFETGQRPMYFLSEWVSECESAIYWSEFVYSQSSNFEFRTHSPMQWQAALRMCVRVDTLMASSERWTKCMNAVKVLVAVSSKSIRLKVNKMNSALRIIYSQFLELVAPLKGRIWKENRFNWKSFTFDTSADELVCDISK